MEEEMQRGRGSGGRFDLMSHTRRAELTAPRQRYRGQEVVVWADVTPTLTCLTLHFTLKVSSGKYESEVTFEERHLNINH